MPSFANKVKFAGVATTISVALLAATAQATIVPQKGMAGVRLSMSKADVRAKLGKPRKTKTGRNDFGPYTQYRFAGRITVLFQSGSTATSISTTGNHERTKNGIGVGSSEQSVRDKFSKATCRTIIKRRSCYLGELKPGKRVTDFQIDGGKVERITIGFVID